MIIAVTGAAGFVGSNLSRRLIEDGHKVIGIDSLTDYYEPAIKRDNLAKLKSSNFRFIQEDINSLDLSETLAEAEVVFHQAGQPGVRKSWGSDFNVYVEANVLATQRLLEWAKTAKHLKKFVYASSSSVYGDATSFPTIETVAPAPLSPYGVTKLSAEHLCTLYAMNFGVPTVSLRYFTVYGPGQRPDMAFTRFTKAAATGGPITIFGSGEQIRDFSFVDDVVEANVLAAFGETTPGKIFNVAGGSSISVNGVLSLLKDISGKELDVRYIDPVAGDVQRTGGSTRQIQRELGWQPKVTISDGLTRQYEWAQRVFGSELLNQNG